MARERFVNPYNFVPFEKDAPILKTREEQYRGSEELVSGWLSVSLYTKTPIIIPDGAHPTYINVKTGEEIKEPEDIREVHKQYDFMKLQDKYTIPGSEIRGLIRSVYETATNSCVREVMDDKPITQRLPAFSSMNKRGLLGYENGRWVLYRTEKELVKKYEVRNKVEADNAKNEILAMSSNNATKPGHEYTDGKILQYNLPVAINPPSDKTPNGQPYSIFKLEKKDSVYTWDVNDSWPYDKLKSELSRDGVVGRDANSNCHKALKEKLEAVKNGKESYVPVYYFYVYRNGEKIVYLSTSAIGRIGNYRKWRDVMGVHAPCKGPEYCPACLLFGSIRNNGLKGHIRFTDAVNNDNDIKPEKHILDILGSPRQSAFEFYYKRPENAKYWNMDFYSTVDAERVVFEDLLEATPRGRKMYWHSNPKKTDASISKYNSTMQAIKTDSPFEFKVYFDQITEEQLNELKWVITLGENSVDSNLQHKIGHAKPLGYGSAKLIINNECIRRLSVCDSKVSYKLETNANVSISKTERINAESLSVLSLLAMVDATKTRGKKVDYPHAIGKSRGMNNDNIYNWFVNNRKNANRLKTLPEPLSDDIELEGEWLDDNSNQNTRLEPNSIYEIGKKYQANVTGRSRNGKSATVMMDNGRREQFYDPYKKYQTGESVELVYKGKNDYGDQFEPINRKSR